MKKIEVEKWFLRGFKEEKTFACQFLERHGELHGITANKAYTIALAR
jgi:hypothetical protein